MIVTHPDYEVSSLGRVRRKTGGKGVRAGRILVPQPINSGYLVVNLYLDGKQRKRTVHSLVAEGFLGLRPSGSVINHKDCDRHNNAAANLEYCDQVRNVRHAAELGRSIAGEQNGQSRLSEADVLEIRAIAARGVTQSVIAARFGICQAHVSDVVTGKRWKHLAGAMGGGQ